MFDVAVYTVEVGREIRSHRQRLGLTLHELASDLPDPAPAAATVGTWELGTRNVTLARIVQACDRLGIQPHELFAAVDARLTGSAPPVPIVNLWALAHTDRPELAVARAWALTLVQAGPEAPIVARLPVYALPPLAALTGCSVTDLIAVLPYVTRGPVGVP